MLISQRALKERAGCVALGSSQAGTENAAVDCVGRYLRLHRSNSRGRGSGTDWRAPSVRAHEALQLFMPVENDVDVSGNGYLFALFDHQEAATVRGDIVILSKIQHPVDFLKEDFRFRRMEGGLDHNWNGHHLVATAVKEFMSIMGPDRFCSALC